MYINNLSIFQDNIAPKLIYSKFPFAIEPGEASILRNSLIRDFKIRFNHNEDMEILGIFTFDSEYSQIELDELCHNSITCILNFRQQFDQLWVEERDEFSNDNP